LALSTFAAVWVAAALVAAALHFAASCARTGGTGLAFFALGPSVAIPQAVVLLVADRRVAVAMWALLTVIGGLLAYVVGLVVFVVSVALESALSFHSSLPADIAGACAGATIGAIQLRVGPEAPSGWGWVLASALGGAALSVFAIATFLGNCGPIAAFGVELPLLAWGLAGALMYGVATAYVLVRQGGR
jgi:hypothetical protein